jgi:hypothetical protein
VKADEDFPMATIPITIDFINGVPTPSSDPIVVTAAQGATVIQWSSGTDVASFVITGLDAAPFTNKVGTPGNGPPYTRYQVTDTPAGAATTYSYTITATHTLGHTAKHDPKIENGG